MASPASQPFSGKYGRATFNSTTPAEVTGWKLTKKGNTQKVCSNSTDGHKRPIPGVVEVSGTLSIKVDANGKVPCDVNDKATLLLFVDSTSSGSGNYWAVEEAVIGELTNECDVDDGKIVAVEYAFDGWKATPYGILAKT